MSHSISNKDLNYLALAALEAQNSCMTMRHGSIAVVSGKVVGRGHNNYRTNSKDGFINHNCSCHAEVHCLRNMFYSQTMHKTGKTVRRKVPNQYVQGVYK